MSKRHISFINEAAKRVNVAIQRINDVGELAVSKRYEFTDEEVAQIYSTLHLAVTKSHGRFSGGTSTVTPNFRLSRLGTVPKRSQSSENQDWLNTFESLAAKRDQANLALRRKRSKPFASDSRADYLLKGVARALLLPPIPKGVSPKTWALRDPASVVILDAKKAAQTFNPTLGRAPQAMIKGRLTKIRTYAPEVSNILTVRAPKGLRLAKSVDARYAVILYRLPSR
jgi:hypothetical protein